MTMPHMAEPQAPPRPRSSPASARGRGLRLRTILLLLLLTALLGRGLGWFGGGREGGGDAGSAAVAGRGAGTESPPVGLVPQPTVSPASDGPSPDAVLVGGSGSEAATPHQPTSSQPTTEPTEPVVPPTPRPAIGAPTEPTAAAGIEPDRFASLVSLLRVRTAEQQLGAALATLARARGLPLASAQQLALASVVADLESAVAVAVGRIEAAVAAGRVLAARADLEQTFAGGDLPKALCQRLGLPPDLVAARACPAQEGSPWPVAVPLTRDRAVRIGEGEAAREGRVAASRADQVTVRIADARGVTFPTVAASACEPVEATAAEALEQAFAALHAGDGLLARLWLAAVANRPAAVDPDRRDRLAAILR